MKRLQLQSWQPQVTKKLLLSFQLNAFINSWQIWWFLLKDYLFNYFYLLMQKNLLINFSTLFFYTAFFPLFLWLCHFHKGFWLYLRRNWISGICQDVSVFFVLFLLPTAAKPDEWGDFSYFSDIDNGILLPKLFWPTVRKICSRDWEKLLKFEAKNLQNFWDH